jgi:hypothetical protein
MSIIKNFKIGPARFIWVLRHRWEKDKGLTNYVVWDMRRRFKLGLWYERNEVVGLVKKGKSKSETVNNTFTKSNHVNRYTIGLDLIVCKTWISFTFKPTLGIKID